MDSTLCIVCAILTSLLLSAGGQPLHVLHVLRGFSFLVEVLHQQGSMSTKLVVLTITVYSSTRHAPNSQKAAFNELESLICNFF